MKQWSIKFKGDKKIKAGLVPPLAPGVASWASLNDEPIRIRWEPKLKTIFIGKEGQTFERVVKIRSSQCEHLPAELLANTRISFGNNESMSYEAQISPVGKETLFRQKALSQKGINIKAPMTGKVIKVCKTLGSSVKKGDVVAIIEAMKMENNIQAQHNGTLESISIKEGETIQVGSPIAVVKQD
ncbi:MAG: acetyl-CoA carboxylase biotin carboxyl carrier protein subunit [Oligoflexales bacterium]|nr:acetyl-CoA carboxylase biotin carboxyl carrier protein subunit [Oligoflexales bacterium]